MKQNIHNNQFYLEQNQHAIVEIYHQHYFSIKVWAPIIEDNLIGPLFLSGYLDCHTYLHFQQDELPLFT